MRIRQGVVALLLAGDRTDDDAVARVSGVPCKALAPIAGIPMIIRVINALQASRRIASWVLCGPSQAALDDCPQLQQFTAQDNVTWLPAGKSLSGSVQAGLEKIDPAPLVLITTADHALLDAGTLGYFLDRVGESRADVSVGLVRYGLIKATYPEVRRTVLRFSNGGYCGCNLYAVSGARGRDIISFWRRIETNRKKPWLMAVRLFGLGALTRYFCGRLSIEQTSQSILKATGITVDFIELPFAHAGIDVDTPEDKELVEKILAG